MTPMLVYYSVGEKTNCKEHSFTFLDFSPKVYKQTDFELQPKSAIYKKAGLLCVRSDEFFVSGRKVVLSALLFFTFFYVSDLLKTLSFQTKLEKILKF